MFGGAKPVRLPRPTARQCPVITDIHMPCPQPYCYAHPGRKPNSNQKIRMVEYSRRKEEAYDMYLDSQKGGYLQDKITVKFDKHTEKRRFQVEMKKRMDIRVKAYDDSIDRRREKLKALIAKEEREYYRETIDVLQRGGETRLQEMKEQAQKLAAIREGERLALIEKKRVQQYKQRCGDLRTALVQKNLYECKNSQIQQMRENQARREADKERERFWYDINLKERDGKTERIEYDAIRKKNQEMGLVEAWDLQMRAKRELQAEVQRIVAEEKVELDKLQAQMEREEYDALIAKERKRELMSKEFEELLAIKEKFMAQRKKEEDTLIAAFTQLGKLEYDRERAKITNTSIIAKQETALYRQNLEQLEEERKEEDARINVLLKKFALEAQQKQDDARCKVELAKRKLLWDTLKGREEQIKEKKALAEKQLELQQADNEFTRMCFETNERLAAEMWRQAAIARKNYQHDLLKQIEYKNHLRQKEKESLERQLAKGMEEEERYLRMVKELCNESAGTKKHPFYCVVVERSDCSCPENQEK